jgi:hypothetical protein
MAKLKKCYFWVVVRCWDTTYSPWFAYELSKELQSKLSKFIVSYESIPVTKDNSKKKCKWCGWKNKKDCKDC